MFDLPKWIFAPTHGGDDDGFSDGLIEHFTGDIDKSLARESIQNSIDARFDDSKPVRVKFQKHSYKRSQIPGIDNLKTIFEACKNYWPNDEKVQKFFSEAIKVADNNSIDILRISDFNTTGLNGGDSDKNGQWYFLVKAQGATSKHEGTTLGSFGIGKGAPFAASAFRTVFYSTLNESGEKIFQGKARLVSHLLDGEIKRGTGSFGLENQTSIRDSSIIPVEFLRTEQGTDINIIAYSGIETEWKTNLINSVLENFWAAIHNGDLEVEIDSEIISKDNIEFYLTQYNDLNDYNSPYYYYLAYTQPSRPPFIQELPIIGECKLYILLQEKAPKRVGLMRKSRMLIKTKHFRCPKPYVGLFICENNIGNQKLRDLEPPQHNDWQPKRHKEEGKKIVDELYKWIRECLKSLIISSDDEISVIPGLEKWFQLPEDDEYDGDVEESLNGQYAGETSETETSVEVPKEQKTTESKVIQRHKEPVKNTTQKAKEGSGKRKRSGKRKKEKGKKGAESGDGTIKKISEINYSMRAFLINRQNGELEYMLSVQPQEDFKGDIKIISTGDDSEYETILTSAIDYSTKEKLKFSGSKIIGLDLKKDQKKRIVIKIKSENKLALKIQ